MIRASYLFLHAAPDGTLPELLRDTLLPLARALPGVQRVDAGVAAGEPLGDLVLRAVLDVSFTDEDAMNAAFASAEGRALARALTADTRGAPEMVLLTGVS